MKEMRSFPLELRREMEDGHEMLFSSSGNETTSRAFGNEVMRGDVLLVISVAYKGYENAVKAVPPTYYTTSEGSSFDYKRATKQPAQNLATKGNQETSTQMSSQLQFTRSTSSVDRPRS